MRVCLNHFGNIEKHIADIETVVLGLAQPYLPQIELILSMPSVNDVFFIDCYIIVQHLIKVYLGKDYSSNPNVTICIKCCIGIIL